MLMSMKHVPFSSVITIAPNDRVYPVISYHAADWGESAIANIPRILDQKLQGML
jgi:hypothetical protein